MDTASNCQAEPRLMPCQVPRARHAASPAVLRAALMGNVLATFTDEEYTKPIFVRQALLRRIVFVNTPSLIREAFVANQSKLYRKSPQLRHAFEPLIDDGVFIGHGETWAARRPVLTQILHLKNTPAFFSSIVAEVEDQAARWAARPEQEADVLKDMSLLALNVVARALFGERLAQEDAHRLIEAFDDFGKKMDHLDLPSLLRMPDWVSRLSHRRLRPATETILSIVDRLVDRTLAADRPSCGVPSFVAQIEAARDAEGRPLDRLAIRNEAVGALLAGYETTGASLAFSLYLLSQADWAQEKIVCELDRVLAGRSPRLTDLEDLPYTHAVIAETLRLYPPVHMLGREASSDFSLGGVPVRAGDQVVAVPYLLHRNPDLWSRPNAFCPDRFLPGAPAIPKNAYIPFALGPRVCPGMMFANCEMTVALAVFLQKFSLSYSGKKPLEPVTHGTLRPGATLPMLISERSPAKRGPSDVEPVRTDVAAQTVTTCPFSSGRSTASSATMRSATASSVTN